MRLAHGLVAGLLWLVPVLALAQSVFPDLDQVREGLAANRAALRSFAVEFRLEDAPDYALTVWRDGASWRQELSVRTGSGRNLLAVAVGFDNVLSASRPLGFKTFPLPITHYWLAGPSWLDSPALDLTRRGYQFLDDTGCLVLGAVQGDLDSAQLWLGTEDFAVVRILTGTEKGRLDVRWLAYRRVGNLNLPHRCGLTLPGGRQLTFALTWNGVNSSLPPELFQVEPLERTFRGGNVLSLPAPLVDFFREFPQTAN